MTAVYIVWNSFKMALQELNSNKLRTFLSLFGITIGIFCIIGVLSTVESLQSKIQGDLKKLGTNTIYITKEDLGEGGSTPWWKYQKRPSPKYAEMQAVAERTQLASSICFTIRGFSELEYRDNLLSNQNLYGVTESFSDIVTVEIEFGRFISSTKFQHGSPVCVIGNTSAENLFGEVAVALGKEIKLKGRTARIVGIVKKQGQGMGWQFDEAAIMPFKFMSQFFVPEYSNPNIMVKGKPNVSSAALLDELRGIMRSIHRLKPIEEDNFGLNDINMFGEQLKKVFVSVNLGGWAIAGLSLIVGAFGIANIMFVSVRERTSQIGLKKAIGAKRSTILTEFLLESSFLSLLGGLLGLLLVFVLTKILSTILPFPIYISLHTLVLSISICVIVGILAGIIPASIAAKMDPVVAIRTR